MPASWSEFLPQLTNCRDRKGGAYAFYHRIQTAKLSSIDVGETKAAVLEVGTPLLGEEERGTRIYWRDAYTALLREVTTTRGSPLVLTGTPGSGKSLFALLLINHFCNGDRPVLYERCPTSDDTLREAVLLHKGEVFEFADAWQVGLAERLPMVYICDAVPPRDPWAGDSLSIIVASLTKPRPFEKFMLQLSLVPRYLPLWSREELRLCDEACGLGVGSAKIEQRYARWGGVARTVLRDASLSNEDDIARLHEAIDRIKAKDALHAISTLCAIECDPVVLVEAFRYEDVKQDMRFYTLVFASPTVARRMRAKLYECDAMATLIIVRDAQQATQLRGVAGCLFEPFALRRFVVGGTFKLLPLGVRDEPTSTDRPAKSARTSEVTTASAAGAGAASASASAWSLAVPPMEEVMCAPGTLAAVRAARAARASAAGAQSLAAVFVPSSPGEPLLDFAVATPGAPLLAIVVTASTDSGISMSGLMSYAAANVPEGEDVHVVFVVPKALAGGYGWQSLRTEANTVWKAPLEAKEAQLVARLKQWVVGIDVNVYNDAGERAREVEAVRRDVARREGSADKAEALPLQLQDSNLTAHAAAE